MKFNKSAESEKWYVAFDNDSYAGKISIYHDEEFGVKFAIFEPAPNAEFLSHQLKSILDKLNNINRESGIDTASTFTSNEDR